MLPASARGYPTRTIDELTPLPGSTPLVARHPGAVVVDLRAAPLVRVVDLSAFGEAAAGLEGEPALGVVVVPEEALAAWDAAGAAARMTSALYRIVARCPRAGWAAVVVGVAPPDAADVFLFRAMGMRVYHAAPGAPLPVLAVEVGGPPGSAEPSVPGRLVIAMAGDGL